MSLRLSLAALALGTLCGTTFQGCATVAVAGASQGVSYTITNVAYRSFTYSQAQVHSAVLKALTKMQITKTDDQKSGEDDKISAATKEFKITVTLTPVTPKVTKVAVDAEKDLVIKDRALAVEILTQTAQALGSR